jgi:hypothetical protein
VDLVGVLGPDEAQRDLAAERGIDELARKVAGDEAARAHVGRRLDVVEDLHRHFDLSRLAELVDLDSRDAELVGCDDDRYRDRHGADRRGDSRNGVPVEHERHGRKHDV